MLLLSLIAAALPSGLALEVAPSAGCGLDRLVEEALERLLAGAPAPALRIAVTAAGADVRVLIRDEGGATVLERVLPAPPDACAATADGIALIVERYLRGLGGAPEVAPLPQPEVPLALRLSVHLVGRLEPDGGAPGLRFGGAAGVRLHLGIAEAGVELAGLAPSAADVGTAGARIRAWSVGVAGIAGACLPGALPRFCAGAGGGFERLAGSAEGALARRSDGSSLAPVGLLELRFEPELPGGFRLVAGARLQVRPNGIGFVLTDGGTGWILPTVSAVLSLGGAFEIL